jgi:hypothetical protein
MPQIANIASADIYKTASPPTGMSLSDMLSLSRSNLAFQKEKELFDAATEQAKAQSKTAVVGAEVAEATKASTISKSQSEAERLGIEAKKAGVDFNVHQANLVKSNLGQYLTDPDFITGNTAKITEKLKDTQSFLSKNGVEDKAGLGEQLISLASSNPKEVYQTIKNYVTGGTNANQQGLINPQPTTINGVQYQVTPATAELKPLGETTPSGQQVSEQPQMPTEQPPVGQPPTKAVQAPSLITNEVIVPRNTGVQQLNTQQRQFYDEGFVAKRDAQSQVIPAKEGRQTVRRVIELSEKAASSKLGQLVERGEKLVFGSTELDELTKNIAALQIQNAAVMGVKTDQQTQNVATASGSINISPEALRDVARRTDASNTAVIKYNDALKSYEQKRGQTHAYINTRSFKDAWASNYDPRIFMVQNINSSGMSKDKKQEEIGKIVKGLSEEELNDLRTKTENLKRLERGDYR